MPNYPTIDGVLAFADLLRDAGVERGYVGGDAFRQSIAQRLLRDPGPLLTALTEAGVLREQHRSFVADGPIDGIDGWERRYVTDWRTECDD